jgi:hypothetical protein
MANLARPKHVESADAWLDAFFDASGTIIIEEEITSGSDLE